MQILPTVLVQGVSFLSSSCMLPAEEPEVTHFISKGQHGEYTSDQYEIPFFWGDGRGRTSEATFSQQARPNSDLSEEAVPKVSSELLIV